MIWKSVEQKTTPSIKIRFPLRTSLQITSPFEKRGIEGDLLENLPQPLGNRSLRCPPSCMNARDGVNAEIARLQGGRR
jgi:hypothetical protein